MVVSIFAAEVYIASADAADCVLVTLAVILTRELLEGLGLGVVDFLCDLVGDTSLTVQNIALIVRVRIA